MTKKLVLACVLYLASVVAAGVMDRNEDSNKGKEPEKKPNIVRDYVCLRDGELCHPEFGKNRGLYVSCSNGVAWEQQCPRCGYHSVNCPTRTLWFDGEKCEWASPKLASQPCIDRFPALEMLNHTEHGGNTMSDQEALLQSLQSPSASSASGSPIKEHTDKNKWQANSVPFFKAPKSAQFEESAEEAVANASVEKAVKVAPESVSAEGASEVNSTEEDSDNRIERKSGEPEGSEAEFPTFLNADDGVIGSKVIRLSDPVYTLVNNPDGSGKQVLMRVAKPFVLEESARADIFLPNLNVISSFSYKE